METYHKIQTLFKRHLDGPQKGKMIKGQWTTPELEYLAGNKWEFTEKVDGTNIRVRLYRSGKFISMEIGGRTDNATIPQGIKTFLGGHFFSGYDIEYEFVESFFDDNDLDEIILFGEGYGPKIQSGGKYTDEHKFVLFDVKIGNWWLKRDAVNDVANKLQIDSVPVIGRGTLWDAIDIVSTGLTFNSSGYMTNWGKGIIKGGLKSQWGDFEAEGIVARPAVDMFDRGGGRIITKIKAVDFR